MSRTVRWGILGTGQVAGQFALGLGLLPDARLQAVGSRMRRSAEQFARNFDVPRAHAGYDELVRDPDVDVIYVATPNSLHREHAMLCLEHGKPVLCEKPFALNAAEGRAVVELARRRGLFCMEGMWMRFTPILRELDRLLASGVAGDVRMLTASLGYAKPFDATSRLFDPTLGGGALLDFGVYALSFAQRVLGTPTSIASQVVLGQTGVDEQVTMLLGYQGGRQAVLSTSLRNSLPNDAVVLGSEATIRVHAPLYCPERLTLQGTSAAATAARPAAGKERLGSLQRVKRHRWTREITTRLRVLRADTTTRIVLGNGYAHEAAEVMRCLNAGELESPLMSLDDTVAVLDTLDAVRASWVAFEN